MAERGKKLFTIILKGSVPNKSDPTCIAFKSSLFNGFDNGSPVKIARGAMLRVARRLDGRAGA